MFRFSLTFIFNFFLVLFVNLSFLSDSLLSSEENKICLDKDNEIIEQIFYKTDHKIIEEKIVERHFYFYSDESELIKIIIDDGCQEKLENLENVTYQHIFEIVGCKDSVDDIKKREIILHFDEGGSKISESIISFNHQDLKKTASYRFIDTHANWKDWKLSWVYDDTNRLICFTEEHAGESQCTYFNYNSKGLLKKLTKPNGVNLFYTYNASGLLESLESSDGTISYIYHYDLDHCLTDVHDLIHSNIQTRTYNEEGLLLAESMSADVNISYDYDSHGELSFCLLPDETRIYYQYDEHHNLIAIERRNKEDAFLYTQTFTTDQTGKLIYQEFIQSDHEKETLFPFFQEHAKKSSQILAVENLKNQMMTDRSSFVSSVAMDKQWTFLNLPADQSDPKTFIYANNKHALDQENRKYFYDALDRLIRIEYPEQTAYTFIYDAFHRRLSRETWQWQTDTNQWVKSSTEQFIHQGHNEIGKLNQQGDITELHLLHFQQGTVDTSPLLIEKNGERFIPFCENNEKKWFKLSANSQDTLKNINYEVGRLLPIEDDQPVDDNNWIYERNGYYHPVTHQLLIGALDYLSFTQYNQNDFSGKWNLTSFYQTFSLKQIEKLISKATKGCLDYFKLYAPFIYAQSLAEQAFYQPLREALDHVKEFVFGKQLSLLGLTEEESEVKVYGEKEINSKVRVSFVNGMLTSKESMKKHLKYISECHGGTNIHYVFRVSQGWNWDASQAILIKFGYPLVGFRSNYARMLAKLWKDLIAEMGGVKGGGTILHYAHSLGGTDTDRARTFLTPEEQKMIRVITFGSATLIKNEGFQSVFNHISINDFVHIFDIAGLVKSFFAQVPNIYFHGKFCRTSKPIIDHMLDRKLYQDLFLQFGKEFIKEFSLDEIFDFNH